MGEGGYSYISSTAFTLDYLVPSPKLGFKTGEANGGRREPDWDRIHITHHHHLTHLLCRNIVPGSHAFVGTVS